MKKKLIQILMLMVATVSVGSFVSCMDTNEDLYNELRHQNLETLTLAEALDARVKALEDLIAKIKSCECDTVKMLGWVNSEDKYLQDQIDAINAALAELAKADNYYTKEQIDKMRDAIQAQIDLIPLTYATKEDLSKLTERVAAIEYLKDEVKTLREELAKIKSCECDCADVMSRLGKLEGEMADVKAKADQALEGLKNLDEVAKAAKTLAENAQSAAENAEKLAQEAQKTANQANTLAEACKTLLDNAVQWASDAKSDAAAAKAMAESNKERITELEKAVSELNTEVSLSTKAANDALQAAADADAKADANKQLIDDLTERVRANEVNIENLKESVKEMKGLAEQVGANTKAIETLEEKIKEYDKLAEEVAALQQKVTDCQEICKTNLELAKAEIRKEIADLKTELVDRISASEAEIKEHHEALEQLGKMIQECATKDDLTKILERLDALEAKDIELDNRLVTTETTVAEMKPVVDKLKEDIYGTGGLMERIQNAEDTLKDLDAFVKKLAGYIQAIQNTLAKQVTGILVQGTYNPMFGSISIPANIQTNMLVAYYGTPTGDIEFPTTDDANYVRKAEVLTAADWAMIKDDLKDQFTYEYPLDDPYIMNGNMDVDGEKVADAGTIYMTINPNTADLDGLQLGLVNSQDEESPIKLSPIQKSDATLQFGFTRADNGFYEAEGYVKQADLKSTLEINQATIEEIAKGFRDRMRLMTENFFKTTGYSGDLGGLSTEVYNIIHELRIDQSGLKCTYTDQDADGNDQEHSVYSQYNVAATVLRPLNLASFKDLHYETIPGYEDAVDFINAIANTLNSHIHFLFKDDTDGLWKVKDLLNALKIDGVDAAKDFIDKFKVRISSFTYNGNGYYFDIPAGGSAIIMFDKNLTYGGAEVTIDPATKVFNDYKDLHGVTLVIGGDLPTNATATLYIPAKSDGDSDISAYAYAIIRNVVVNVASGVIEVAYDGGAKIGEVGTVSGSTISAGSYPNTLVLEDLKGTQGSVSFPVVAEIAGDATDLAGILENFIADVNTLLNHIYDYDEMIAGSDDDYHPNEGWINKFLAKYLMKYLDKINNTTVYFFNSINRRFGPFLVARNDKGFKVLSTGPASAPEMDKEGLSLYPTTKNMELIVPIARKHVAVTDVYNEEGKSAQKDGYASLKQALKNANSCEKLNAVIDGTERRIPVDASKLVSGYTYEVAYSVLDFEGNISTLKYYFKVK